MVGSKWGAAVAAELSAQPNHIDDGDYVWEGPSVFLSPDMVNPTVANKLKELTPKRKK